MQTEITLRQAAQQALEALTLSIPKPRPADDDYAELGWEEHNAAITALRAALAEPDSDYERGFVDGMNLQTKGSVDKAVNRMAQTTHWEGCEAVHPECRKPEQEPDGISWLKRDNDYFTAPTPRKPLTDDEIVDIWAGVSMGYDDQINIIELGRAIERHHGIGEQHE